MDLWVANRLQGIFFATAVGKLTDESRNQIINESSKSKEDLYDMLTPYRRKPTKEEIEKEKVSDENKGDYISALGNVGVFNSLDQLMSAVQALNETITENNSNADTELNGSTNAN